MDGDTLAASLDCPVLLWEGGLCIPDGASELVLTADGGTTFNPSPVNPIVLQVRPESTRSEVAGISVGRSDSNDVVVQNPSVSRLHALIHRDARSTEWHITDAGSRNGTRVNEVPVARELPAVLTDGCTVTLGDIRLRFLLPDAFLRLLQTR
jgi:pSer/pThr/pTyr-binding forkhead associated (FHA) protein